MKLSRLYTNKTALFTPIDFNPGLNVVEAQIRLPENLDRDTHNLGKSTLGVVLDFTLLSRRDPDIFLWKRPDLFGDLAFHLEVQVGQSSYLTIRRTVADHTRIWLMRHSLGGQDFSETSEAGWSHTDMPFDRARDLVDGILDLRDVEPWKFRNVVGYFLRSQDDYQDVFRLKDSVKAVDWKPVLAKVLGFNGEKVDEHFRAASELDRLAAERDRLQRAVKADALDPNAIDGRIQLIESEIEKQQRQLDALDFEKDDRATTERLVATLNEEVSVRNRERYYLAQSRTRIEKAIKEAVPEFRAEEAARLFEEAGVTFPEGLVRDYDQLLTFNRAMTRERRKYLKDELAATEQRLNELDADLKKLNQQRSVALATIAEKDVFRRYKAGADGLVRLKTDREQLLRKRAAIDQLRGAKQAVDEAEAARAALAKEIDADLKKKRGERAGTFGQIVGYFSAIVQDVVDHQAVLTAALNNVDNIEFGIDIFDEYGASSNAGAGNTYRKVLCAAFDLAVIRAHLPSGFPQFAYHDGLFESLDDRKKRKLMAVARQYAALGVQQVITVIDSDLPDRSRKGLYEDEDVVLVLHDEGPEGRLFHLPEW